MSSLRHVAPWLMALLGGMALVCLLILLNDRQFKRVKLWHWQDFSVHLADSVLFFLPWASVVTVGVYLIKPELFLQWPLQKPMVWLLTLLIYPLISVIPQEIIFRTYFFHRYKKILPSKNWRWTVSTFVFGLAHAVYGNWVAVVLSWCGGALFGYRYIRTQSTPVVVIEHALWGSFIFTVGLGSYLVISPS
ncbi:CPBP family intramembrane metalloprotease [Alteromonas pelagimontana]|uniref:CPBP family intramembrane metalloprotease n=2 Tax=Alteromonas pelagimontana TaxID=1858656 RepID=A0A6M4MJ72_9ALTE|nr:CPBP family intramembrane metalloprotease [Alteromonas pelagimontana]